MTTTTDRHEAFERLKLAYAEYRAEVTLGWDRHKLFLTLNPTLTALAGLATHASHKGIVAGLCFGAAAFIALVGCFVVLRSHGRYQAARAALQSIEDELGLSDLQTTGGQRAARGGPRLERFRVVDALVAVLVALALLDVALALVWG